MPFIFRTSTLEDITALLAIQQAAFQEDLEKYEDFETSPACETPEKLEENIHTYHHFTILDGETIIGAIDVRGHQEHRHIDKLFIAPSYQNKGAGTAAMEFLKNQFPDAQRWSLYTPSLSFRNHHFYEKSGFTKKKRLR
ncbi:GNAT family N-acetyltransferase [Bacillus massiliglaciei]|uniref:GNAT family N-acetyltransferase n=1 Tax=Bacillus massiliglaciei TaxID=1816693 RepID=UPI0018FEF4C0|nr:GNAT family N-acetyltransferase [Bacillus massiliglaciei]